MLDASKLAIFLCACLVRDSKVSQQEEHETNPHYQKLDHCIIQFQGFDRLSGMEYEPFYHAREIATIKFSSGRSCKAKSTTSGNIS